MAKAQRTGPSPWLKRVLIPFWTVQLVLMGILLGLFITDIVADPSGFAVYMLLLLILSAVCIILDVTEIILFARQKLQPLAFLVLQCVKTTIWFALFLNAIIRGSILQQRATRINTSITYGAVTFGILFFAFLGSLIYAGVILHRYRRSKRKGVNITQNPYYQGPYSEAGIATANYQPLPSPTQNGSTATGDESTAYRSETVKRPYAEIGGYTAVPPELGSTEVEDHRVKELPAQPQVFELATVKSWKTSRDGA